LACNPAYGNINGTTWNLDDYLCSQACVVPPYCDAVVRKNNTRGGDGQTTCYCNRANLSVGVESFGTAPSRSEPGIAREDAAVKLPPVCSFGAVDMRMAESCLDGDRTALFEGPDLNTVASKCCMACDPSDCAGFRVVQLHNSSAAATRYQCATLRGNLTRDVPAGGATCIGSAKRDPLTAWW
jgi:hypothetical protein